MALQKAFKSVAKGSRSKILKQKGYDLREKELISKVENLTDVIRFGWESRMKPCTKPLTKFFCIVWVRSPTRIMF